MSAEHVGTEHHCNRCDEDYTCDQPGWACPTVNGDENGNLCRRCEDEAAEEYQRWYDEQGGEA